MKSKIKNMLAFLMLANKTQGQYNCVLIIIIIDSL